MMSLDGYGLEVGEQGRSRLEVLEAVHNPASLRLLEEAGLSGEMVVLDVGCGIGGMTAEIAKRAERVVGVDASAEQLALAPQRENVAYVCAPAEDLSGVEGPFDLVYCRHLLQHVRDPERVLSECVRQLKPDGLLVIETDAGTEAHFSEPASEAFDRWAAAAERWAAHQGSDFAIGKKLPQMLEAMGLQVEHTAVYQPLLRTALEKSLLTLSVVEGGPAFVAAGLATAQEMADLEAGLREFEASDALAGYTPVAQVIARRN